MANVNINFNGKEFVLSCEDGQEEHLEELASHLNQKFNNLKSSLGNIGESKLLLITSITIMDEYYETKKKIDQKIEELKNITEKFKELKALVYDYKENKEEEINELNKELSEIKIDIDRSKEDYEKIIDNATDKIESFLKKASLESPIQ
tara:strand:- start:198 stop:644 length:447 start_codon:yes stop_codon:yes gene_type:complete